MTGRAKSEEVEAFLKANPDLEAAEAFVTDPTGIARGKLLRAADLAKIYQDGRPLPCSIMSLDITGEDVEETGLVWDKGDEDKLAWPIVGTLKRAPWMARPSAQVLLSLYDLDGSPYVADPRHVLAQVVERLKGRRLHGRGRRRTGILHRRSRPRGGRQAASRRWHREPAGAWIASMSIA